MPERIVLKPTCIWKEHLYPEDRGRVELVASELKSILDFCKKDKTAFSPPQWGNVSPQPEIVQLDDKTFAYVGIGKDAICFQRFSKDDAKEIAKDAMDYYYHVGRRQEADEMEELFYKMFPEEK